MLWIFYLNFEENIKNSVKMMGPNSLIFYHDAYIWNISSLCQKKIIQAGCY